MRFLIDNQLPEVLVRWLSDRGHDATHVLREGMAQTDDRRLWELALNEGRIVISKDEDFFLLATRPGETGRLLWLRMGNCRTPDLVAALEAAWPAIEQVFAERQRIVEVR